MTSAGAGQNAARKAPSELKLRIVSAILLLPIALLLIYVGGLWYAIGVVLCSVLLLREWTVIVGAADAGTGVVIAYVAVVSGVLCAILGAIGFAVLILGLSAAGLLIYGLVCRAPTLNWLSGGVLYAGLSGAALIGFRNAEHGLAIILFLFAVVWMTDIFAYFVGRRVGGPKLWRRVSPKKTWSGALGGLAAALLTGFLAAVLIGEASLVLWLLAAFLLSVFSQIGDLLESSLKRRFGVKDSGHIIPGHGGVMDRLDGVVGAAVLGYATAAVTTGSWVDPVRTLLAMQGT